MNGTQQRTALVIKKQIGIFGLGTVGASDFAFTKDGGLTFRARLHFKGQTRVRVCRVTVTLNASDLYDIRVHHDRHAATFTDIGAEQLTAFMYDLDSKGF